MAKRIGRPRIAEPAHGEWRRYFYPRFSCRCESCRDAARRYLAGDRGPKTPSRFTCPGCGHRCATPEGHARCRGPEHVSEILPRVLSSFGGR